MLQSAMKKYCLIRDISLKDLEDQHDRETGSVLISKVELVRADLFYPSRTARGQGGAAHDVFSKTEMEDEVRLMGSVVAPGAHGKQSARV